ncbi:response regulator [Chryseolinea sp. H1M3-3]|uniref:response regulator n=1 Tax=Chryseolinea sp. H1M3-3 TaxID=3034144 RepID=UPI0023EDB1DE|nr:response regulator [Chryseolinea sp. H1M3-3]
MERIKVILVDNDPDELFFMEKGFEASDRYAIIAQCSGWPQLKEFIQHADELPDLIITDLNMPGKNGVDIASMIHSNPAYNAIKVVVLSITTGDNNKGVQANLSGSSLFIPKPSSLLEYESFAIDLYEKINIDVFNSRR